MAAIRLSEAGPNLLKFLSEEDRADAERLALPLIELPAGAVDLRAVFEPVGAFGGVVVDGALLESLQIGDHVGMRLLGHGDVVGKDGPRGTGLLRGVDHRAIAPTRMAGLGREFLLGVRRWPLLAAGLQSHNSEQAGRLAAQMLVCQLPRVDDRLLAMLWLLAETWGHVSSTGTVVPFKLTHSALGALVGARRPTVSLAVTDLVSRGAVVRQSDGWLLLQAPPTPAGIEAETPGEPRLVPADPSVWSKPAAPAPAYDARAVAAIRERISRLEREHTRATETLKLRVEAMRSARETLGDAPTVITDPTNDRPPAPSG